MEAPKLTFSSEEIKRIKAGRQSQTRRLSAPYRPGRCYKVQNGRKTTDLKVTITSITEEKLEMMTVREARRNGFRTTTEFLEAWKGPKDATVQVISFVVGDQSDTPRLLAARPGPPSGDYTSSTARALRGTAEEAPQAVVSKYAAEAVVNHRATHSMALDGLKQALDGLNKVVSLPSDRKRLKSIVHHVERLELT